MYYPVCAMVHIKEPLLLIGMSNPCGGSGVSLSLSEWSFTICPTPYNRKLNVLSASLNKTFPSFTPCMKGMLRPIQILYTIPQTGQYIPLRCTGRSGSNMIFYVCCILIYFSDFSDIIFWQQSHFMKSLLFQTLVLGLLIWLSIVDLT